ncbi:MULTISPECIES: TetR/AcrR family transcriptional regulator [Streptomyces]|jgi:AcrR family transcriptional regulator|uniref:TetR/AcrR family transcriptional regulator n=1 Tax=Streptomyces doudnae TaxID=3075536 RepID=A0ABD5EF69_9ACTN|nr:MULTISPECIES: TetR/AcrR family transcriptional regulator [unclassified Streptomyces]MDT0433322.1 TetR/AcrR family transcriptional regulator [Streptomyces sp. DSM 41981]MYQ68091.1 TetR family transcriptional regulator [Streptomyces sp. SID4950]
MSTRDELVRAALRVASTDGFGALSVRGVAREAGVGATTLRHYFPSQADLHLAVTTELITSLLTDLAIEDDTEDPAVRLYDCLAQFLPDPATDALSRGNWFDLYFTALAPNASAALRNVLRAAHEASTTAVRRWLRTLAAQGHMAEEDIEDQAAHVLVIINGMHLCAVIDPERYNLPREKRLLRWYARQLLSG